MRRFPVLLFLLAAAAWAAEPEPFSHKRHAPLKMKCATCHSGAEKEDQASFPALSQCRTCHVDMAARTIPSKRIYKVKDFVFFSHAAHAGSKTECATCHGEVYAMDTLTQHRPVLMYACVNCHKEHKATVVCNACHELGQ